MINLIRNNRGGALFISLSLLAMLTIIGLLAVQTSNTDIELSGYQVESDKSFYIADAGAKRAVLEVVSDYTWRTGFADVALANGAYTVIVEDSAADSTLADTILITASGTFRDGVTNIEVVMTPVIVNPFSKAMFGDSWIDLDRETCTDSYNSDSGTYAGTVLDTLADIGSNGTISSSKSVTFGGGIQVATEGGISLGPFNTINGDTTSTADSVSLDIIPASEYTWAESVSKAMTGISGSNFNYDNGTKDLILGSTGDVVLQSGVYFFNDLTLGSDSRISLAAGAQITIYVTGTVHFAQNSVFNENGKPSDAMIYSSGPTMQFDQGNIFYGAFYGPNAHVQYDQTTEVYGSLIGGSIRLDRGACFHYDRNLANITRRLVDKYESFAWREL
ncbi:MAG: pilus assembly PilX N-terminal domain-containing protein [candidate division Zixibacteria bacterium]